jgi:hypothetical protein
MPLKKKKLTLKDVMLSKIKKRKKTFIEGKKLLIRQHATKRTFYNR